MLTRNGLKINKSDITKEQIKKLRTELEVEPFTLDAYNVDDVSKTFKVYQENDEYITIPRFYNNLSEILPYTFENYSKIPTYVSYFSNINCELSFNGKIRKKQEEPINAMLKALRTVGG